MTKNTKTLVTAATLVSFAALAAVGFVSLARPRFGGETLQTPRTSAMELRRAAETWRGAHEGGACPTPAQLRADRAIDHASKTTDPWGHEYRIACADEDTTVSSDGPDRVPGTSDDIVVPEPARPH